MKSRALSGLFAIAAVAAAPQVLAQAPARTATDADVTTLLRNMEGGCIERALQGGDTEAGAKALCTCNTKVLRAKVPLAEWQSGIAAAMDGDQAPMQDILKRHQDDLGICKSH